MKKIISARIIHGEWFDSKEEFLNLVNKTRCNKRVQENLELVGAFASVTENATPAKHTDRLKAQMELLPGLIIDTLRAERAIAGKDPHIRAKLLHVKSEVMACKDCDLCESTHVPGSLGKAPKFVVVFDCPSYWEDQKGAMLEKQDALRGSLKASGMSIQDGYYTTLVKAKKNSDFLSNGQINACGKYLTREIEILKPPVIITMGTASTKFFDPTLKGGIAEHIGKTTYSRELDATLVVGFNPAQIHFDPKKQVLLDEVFAKVASMVL